MIPLAIPAALRALPWRLIGWGALVAVVALAGWRVSAWREAYQALPAAQEALQREIDCGDGSECLKRAVAARAQAEAASAVVLKGYEDEIESLRNRPVERRVIRVCSDARGRDVPDAAAARPIDGSRPAAGELHGSVEFDTGPLRDLAREADEVTARYRALQQWHEAVSKAPD